MMKNILYCEHNVDGTIGGSYYSLFYLVTGLDKTLFRPVVVFYKDNMMVGKLKEAGIETMVIEPPTPVLLSCANSGNESKGMRSGFLKVIRKTSNFFKLFLLPTLRNYFLLGRHRIDIVHLNNSILHNHDWMLAAMLRNIPCITHERGINNAFPYLARFFGKRLRAVICISDAVKQNMRAHGVDYENMVTIHNGFDPDTAVVRIAPEVIRERHGIREGDLTLGIVGNIKEWKGQETVVRSIAILKNKYPNVKCLIVGDTSEGDRYYEKRIRDLIDRMDLIRNIIFTGFQKNVPDYINVMDILIHASIDPEPFGRVLLEGMALKKPLVGANGGAVPEIVEEGVSGLTFIPGDPESLAAAISTIASDRERMRRMGDIGYRRLMERFHIRQNLESTERIYERQIANA
jgi:glycosyltransferase involved in cell wall biosynthesis